MSNKNDLIFSITIDGRNQDPIRDWMSAIVHWHEAKSAAIWSASVQVRKASSNWNVPLALYDKDRGETVLQELLYWQNPPFPKNV